MTPRRADYQSHIDAIIQAVLVAVDPNQCVGRTLRTHPAPQHAEPVIALGKAAPAMFEGYVSIRGEPSHRFMLAPEDVEAPPWAHLGDHPLPTARNIAATNALIQYIERYKQSTPHAAPVVLLLSGGASALLTLPDDSIPLDEYRALTQSLLRAGADIHQLNCVRKHAERLKGGRLARLLSPRPVHALILSDVIGDDLSVIGSGPLSPDPTTFQDALAVLQQFGVSPASVHAFLESGQRGDHAETPKPGDPIFQNVTTEIIANNETAVLAAADAARSLGFRVAQTRTGITGDAAGVGRQIALEVAASPPDKPTASILGCETTVDVGDASGIGGPSTEVALAAALELERQPDPLSHVLIATFATDGVDGPTDAAGAIATASTPEQARHIGLDPHLALSNHDSHTLFNRLGTLIRTGPTGTNVNDIVLAFAY